MTPRPHHAGATPQRRKTGTTVPEAAMPRPTPVKMTPLATPRRSRRTWGSTVGAARTMSTPPAIPAAARQTKYHANDTGTAHAKNPAVASAIMARSAVTRSARAASQRASSAPAR
jgi:hypothetical protein